MKLLILGSGTSTGVPVIGCGCRVCTSTEPRNRRTRASALIQSRGKNILIDTSTDLRAQALSNGITRIDAVLFTHPHADHIHGIDDLRSFNMIQDAPIPCYGDSKTIERIRVMFEYIFREEPAESWRPNLTTTVVEEPFTTFDTEITPLKIHHGRSVILGFRVGGVAYLTDCSAIPAESMERLRGLDLLVIGALRRRPHPTHFSIDQALEAVEALKPKKAVLTHLSHTVDYTTDNGKLPQGVELAYDGMVVEAG